MVTVPVSPVKNAPGSYAVSETYTFPAATIDSGVAYAKTTPGTILNNSTRQIIGKD
jgi:hypothetical protein